MTLKSFGCSFIFGTDLSDVGRGEPYEKSSQLTWPALLAQDLGRDYQCYARPGSGNLRILEKILTQAGSSDSTDLFVIGWSWIDRFDYTVYPTGHDHIYDLVESDLWRTIMPNNNDTVAKTYYRDFHSQFRDKLTTLINIKTAIDVLKQKNISFIMTYMDDSIFETKYHVTTAITDIQNYIQPSMTQFNGKNFLSFSKEKGFPISETLHPLEPAHRAAFELVKSNFDTILHKA